MEDHATQILPKIAMTTCSKLSKRPVVLLVGGLLPKNTRSSLFTYLRLTWPI